MARQPAPKSVGRGVVGRAFVEHQLGAEQQRTGDCPRTHHPAEVGEPEQAVAGPEVEAVGQVLRALDREAAVDVDGALGPAGRARRVDDHVGRLGVGLRRRRGAAGASGSAISVDHQRSRPSTQASCGASGLSRPTTSIVLDGRRLCDCGVRGLLHADLAAAAESAVDRDKQGGTGVVQPARNRRGRIAGEDRDVDRLQLAKSQYRDDRLWQQRQEDADAVAFAQCRGARTSPLRGRPRPSARALVRRRTLPSSPSQVSAAPSGSCAARGSTAAEA